MVKGRCPPVTLIIVGIAITTGLLWLWNRQQMEGFAAVADPKAAAAAAMAIPQAKELLQPKITKDEANECFRKTLVYVENNPDDLDGFLTFLKSAFFTEASMFKSPLTVAGVAGKWDRGFRGTKPQ
jgi:hypothetical protein